LSGVLVVVLHPTDDDHAGPLTHWLTAIRADLAERHRVGFERVAHGLSGPRGVRDPGAALVDARVEVRVEAGRPDGRPFGARLRDIVATDRPEGIVILGSGALALATDRDRRRFVEAATSTAETALANNRFSADAIAIARVDRLPVIPDLPTDNELPSRFASCSKSKTGATLNCPKLCFTDDLKIAYSVCSSSNFISVFVG
jgi:hypothetical protein